ncbi:Ankyrin repeat domain-containing protein 50, partial [Fusarium oxysporum f. sp. albedinis]
MTTMITDSSLQMVLSGTVFVSTIYGAAIVWYRLYLHPLSQYPGPFWSWISAFQDIATLLDRIGIYEICLTFRITPNIVLINTPSGLTTIYNNKANVKKAVYYKVYPCNVHDMKTWNSIDKATHARKRRAMNHAFSDKALRSSGPFIHFNIDRWIELLKEEIRERQWSCSLHMAWWADRLVFDTLGDLCFGVSFGMKEHYSELRRIPPIIKDFISTILPVSYGLSWVRLLLIHDVQIANSPFTFLWAWFKPRGLDYLLAAAPPAMSKCCKHDVNQVLRVERTFSNISSWPWSGYWKECSNEEVFIESGSLVIAGSDTSAIGLAAAFFYLTRNPHAQEKHAKESRAAFSSVGGIQGGA